MVVVREMLPEALRDVTLVLINAAAGFGIQRRLPINPLPYDLFYYQ